MKRKNCLRFLCHVALYFGIILLFAVINWRTFEFNSTSFFVSEQLNKRLKRYDVLSQSFDLASYHRDVKDMMPITISEFDDLINPTLDSLDALNMAIESRRQHMEELEAEIDSIKMVVDAERVAEIDSIRRSFLSVYQQKIDSIENCMAGKDSTTTVLDGTYVAFANAKLEYARKWAEIESRIMENYDLLGGPIGESFLQKNDEFIKMRIEMSEDEQSRREISSRIRSLSHYFHLNRRNAVTFWDFLYYSICVGTTVSFGDIAPNSGWTRFLAVFELLLCVCLVAYILGFLRPRDTE